MLVLHEDRVPDLDEDLVFVARDELVAAAVRRLGPAVPVHRRRHRAALTLLTPGTCGTTCCNVVRETGMC